MNLASSHSDSKRVETSRKIIMSTPKSSATPKTNRTLKSNVLSNVNSAIFAMLLQRTTFTVILVLSSVLTCGVSGLEVVTSSSLSPSSAIPVTTERATPEKVSNASEEIKPSLPVPVYIPLTEPTKEKEEGRSLTKPSFIKKILSDPAIQKKYSNTTFDTGNTLWDGLLNECIANPTLSCIQKNVYTYLDGSLGFSGDVNITEGFRFKKNKLASWKYTAEANKKAIDAAEKENSVGDEDDDDDQEGRGAESPIEEVTNALYNKGVNFMMSHDLELRLPAILFDGATLKVSPRGLEEGGALLKVDMLPRELQEASQGRIFFKKIKKYFKNKLLMGLLGIVIVIKLLKLKMFFLVPLLLGVHNAKKFFLKFVLFIFPALSNIFRLCSWYHNNYHSTKYHHHHHQISHLHHAGPHGGGFSSPGGHSDHGGYAAYPPAGPPGHLYQHEPQDWQFSGPGLGPEYISGGDVHRNAVAFSPRPDDANDISSWGLAPSASGVARPGPSPYYDEQRYVRQAQEANRLKLQQGSLQGPPLTAYGAGRRPANTINAVAEKEALIRAERQRQEQARIAQAQAEELARQQAQQQLLLQQQQAQQQHQQATNYSPQVTPAATPVYDAFYSPILQRVERVFAGLAFHDEPCRERLVCSMYKDPQRYSPHSNLVSNELSRDASELQKPAPGSSAAIRFYRYVQAARDGQERKDCLRLYPLCSIDTEKKK